MGRLRIEVLAAVRYRMRKAKGRGDRITKKNGSVDLGHHTRGHTRYALGTHTHQHQETPPHSNFAEAHTRQVRCEFISYLSLWYAIIYTEPESAPALSPSSV